MQQLFLANDLDLVIYLITAVDVSHINEVEGVMPAINLVLENQAFSRKKMRKKVGKIFQNANSSQMIRERLIKSTKNNVEDTEDAWYQFMSPVKDTFKKRFQKCHIIIILYIFKNLQMQMRWIMCLL